MSSLEPDAVGLIIQRACEYLQPVMNAILAGLMALLHGAYRNVGMRRRLLNAGMCALLAWTVRDALALTGLELKWANLASVLIGFLGADYISALIKRFIGKKTGFKDDK
ncbi:MULTISPECIES: phage holin, lambda family [Serratia]|jgi:lambda family phage holin|uniref:Phage holin, lambda family n=1 Tax=Serratia liquefaciens TaxID=614 RepID=A0A379YHP1_SERLI|nr:MULTISPECIES: phage holin, lambda family [Serratia]AGQ28802.1 holin [Serratia liquefaciens ATCC 27592]AKE09402.1 holin [Serratia liquefaciens]AMH01134.1 phage holin, lambda family [Serratia liquefaciens]AYO39243.1 phage holin, lambda family [Serratia sp. P2ACOL2]MBF8106181.1 phage holin, lambda family [Serratia liquefaciens]